MKTTNYNTQPKIVGQATLTLDAVESYKREDGTFVVPLRIAGRQPCISGKPVLCYTQYENHALFLEQGGTHTFDIAEANDVYFATRKTPRVEVQLD